MKKRARNLLYCSFAQDLCLRNCCGCSHNRYSTRASGNEYIIFQIDCTQEHRDAVRQGPGQHHDITLAWIIRIAIRNDVLADTRLLQKM